MNVREKLIDLIIDAKRTDPETGSFTEHLAEHLIAHGVTVQEWVDVKDRLPEESGMYIVTANDGHAQRVSFVLWQNRNRMLNLIGARSYWRVTHWMPLPEPPKEGTP